MTKNEFEERIGREVSMEEYAKADAVYMACDMEKDQFCDEYKKHNCELIHDLAHNARQAERIRAEKCSKLNEVGEFLARQYYFDGNVIEELRTKAIEILGKREYIKHVIEQGYDLTRKDSELILELI